MPTGYYALDHPNPNAVAWGNALGFWGYPTMKYAPQAVVMHTTESLADHDGPDTGAENVANWFQTNNTFALYHTLVDSDSTVPVVPAGLGGTAPCTAFHAAGFNSYTLGCSMAMQAHTWPSQPAWFRNQVLDRAAAVVAAWCKRWSIPVVLRTKAEVEDGAKGITGHGILDPGSRSDPGVAFPWEEFLARVRALLDGQISPPPGSTPIPTTPTGSAATRLVLEDNSMIHQAVKRPGSFPFENTVWDVWDVPFCPIDGAQLGQLRQHVALVITPVHPETAVKGHTVLVFRDGHRMKDGKAEHAFSGPERIQLSTFGVWTSNDIAGRISVLTRPDQPVHVQVRELSYF